MSDLYNRREAIRKIADSGYSHYYCKSSSLENILDDHTRSLNCSDEVCPGSHDRIVRVRELFRPTSFTNFVEDFGRVISEFHDLVVEEIMCIAGWSESEANTWFNHYVDVNHVQIGYSDELGDYFIFEPVLLPVSKYK